jgi:hypothetical protein
MLPLIFVFHAERFYRYPKPWLDNVKDEPNWEAVVYYTSAVLAFCELDIYSLNFILEF